VFSRSPADVVACAVEVLLTAGEVTFTDEVGSAVHAIQETFDAIFLFASDHLFVETVHESLDLNRGCTKSCRSSSRNSWNRSSVASRQDGPLAHGFVHQ